MSCKTFLGHLVYILMQPYLFFCKMPNRAYVILFDEKAARVLLVKNWLSLKRWSLPGGGLKNSESHLQAAQREVREEINLSLPAADLKRLEILPGANRFVAGCRVYYLCRRRRRAIKYNRRELVAAHWYALNRLPPVDDQLKLVLARLAESLSVGN